MSTLAPGWPTTTLDPPERDVIKREKHTVLWVERESGDGARRVVKLYRRRGRLSEAREKLTGFRAEREFKRLSHLVSWGVPCTVPLAWAHGFSPEHGWHEILVTREVPGAIQLEAHLGDVGPEADLAPLLRTVRQMHESGLYHGTLFGRNVLVVPEAPPEERYFLCDVPRSWVFPRTIVGTRLAHRDLRDLLVDLVEAGMSPGAIPWAAYGLGEEGRRRVTRPWTRDPRTGRSRTLRDMECRVRWAAAWLAFWKGGPQPPAGATMP